MTILISIGTWGGIYVARGYTWRVCLGWVAVTVIPQDDGWIMALMEGEEG